MTFNELQTLAPGAILEDGQSHYWIVLAPNNLLTSGMLANLFTGQLEHCTTIQSPVKPISHLEIMW